MSSYSRDDTLGFFNTSHFRSVQHEGSLALHLFTEAVRIQNLDKRQHQIHILETTPSWIMIMYQDPVENTLENQDVRHTKNIKMTSISTTLGVMVNSDR